MAEIKFFRGPEAGIPTLSEGEPGFCLDTGQLYIGGPHGRVPITHYITPEAYGAVANDSKDCTAAFALATAAAAGNKVILLGAGTYRVTSTPGNYAVNVRSRMVGLGPNVSVIKNIGTGSAMKMGGTSSDIYYVPFEGFSVIGNAASEDGLVTNVGAGIPTETAYCNFKNIKIQSHGRHGLVHRASWATKYQNCLFLDNGGLGAYFESEAGDDGSHGAVSLLDCHIGGNGGTGNVSTDYLHGGLRIGGGAALYVQGGSIENNNAWGLILGHNTAWTSRAIEIKNVYFEQNPRPGSASTVGGNVRVDEKYESIAIHDCWMQYGADLGTTGYCFYVAHGPESNYYFKEYNNYVGDYGAGTNIRDYGLKFDWTYPLVSRTLNAGTHTILHSQVAHEWSVNGFIHCKSLTANAVGGIYPFIAAFGASSGQQVLLGYAIVGGSYITPTLEFTGGGGALEVTIPTGHTGHVELSLGGAEGDPSDVFSPNIVMFTNNFIKRASPA